MFVTSGRAQLAYEITGAADGADVLLIHAGVNDRRSWQHVIERLASRHRCIAYDVRGFGETTYEREDGWSPVADAEAVLDAAGVEQAVIVACSMGGRTALDLTLAQPDHMLCTRTDWCCRTWRAVPGSQGGAHGQARGQDRVGRCCRGNRRGQPAGSVDVARWTAVDEGRVSGPARDLFLTGTAKRGRRESRQGGGDTTGLATARRDHGTHSGDDRSARCRIHLGDQ